VASRQDPTWAIGISGPEVHEVIYTGGCGRRGGIVDVHTGVRRRGRCECAADVLSVRCAAYGDCTLTDCDRTCVGIRVGCPHAAHVWPLPHEDSVGREAVPHEDVSRCSGEQCVDDGNPEHRRVTLRESSKNETLSGCSWSAIWRCFSFEKVHRRRIPRLSQIGFRRLEV